MLPIDPLQLQYDSLKQLQEEQEHMDDDLLFLMRPINQWMEQASQRPIPRMLFGKLWYQGELCILFADSNVGKSILAVQIGNSISTGAAIQPFAIEAERQPVLYCDFELTDKQFEARYSDNFTGHYIFKNDFYRAEINPDSEPPQGYNADTYLNLCLEYMIVQSKAKVVIIDNLTYLRDETEQAKDALPLMKHLKNLKNKYNLSMLVLAHTPKRDTSQPINRNDLQGSKMLMNFCDSAFTIGESQQDKDLRYIKQIKQRNTEQVYGGDNVCLCHIVKPTNFLQFEFVGYGMEWQHLLKNKKEEITDSLKNDILTMHQQGFSLREIGRAVGISFQKANRIIKAAQKESE